MGAGNALWTEEQFSSEEAKEVIKAAYERGDVIYIRAQGVNTPFRREWGDGMLRKKKVLGSRAELMRALRGEKVRPTPTIASSDGVFPTRYGGCLPLTVLLHAHAHTQTHTHTHTHTYT